MHFFNLTHPEGPKGTPRGHWVKIKSQNLRVKRPELNKILWANWNLPKGVCFQVFFMKVKKLEVLHFTKIKVDPETLTFGLVCWFDAASRPCRTANLLKRGLFPVLLNKSREIRHLAYHKTCWWLRNNNIWLCASFWFDAVPRSCKLIKILQKG